MVHRGCRIGIEVHENQVDLGLVGFHRSVDDPTRPHFSRKDYLVELDLTSFIFVSKARGRLFALGTGPGHLQVDSFPKWSDHINIECSQWFDIQVGQKQPVRAVP